jgi:hypothetical protein
LLKALQYLWDLFVVVFLGYYHNVRLCAIRVYSKVLAYTTQEAGSVAAFVCLAWLIF